MLTFKSIILKAKYVSYAEKLNYTILAPKTHYSVWNFIGNILNCYFGFNHLYLLLDAQSLRF